MRTAKAIFFGNSDVFWSLEHADLESTWTTNNFYNPVTSPILSILQNESTGCCVDCPQGGACDVFHRLLTVNRLSEDVGHKAVPPLHLGKWNLWNPQFEQPQMWLHLKQLQSRTRWCPRLQCNTGWAQWSAKGRPEPVEFWVRGWLSEYN